MLLIPSFPTEVFSGEELEGERENLLDGEYQPFGGQQKNQAQFKTRA